MDEESKKMRDLDSVKTGQGASIIDPKSTIEETAEEIKEESTAQPAEGTGEEEVDEDLLEIVHSFEKNQEAISNLFKDGVHLPVEDLIVFKDKADDVIGYELDDFVGFLAKNYSLAKTKFSLNWDDIMKALQEWVVFQTEERKREKVEDWMEGGPDMDYPGLPDEDELDTEKYRQREKSKDLLTMKLQNYADQIRDIFKANQDQEDSDAESDDEEQANLPIQVRISKLSKVVKDMGLLCGIVFTNWQDYISGNIDEKKTKKEIVEKIKRYMWKDTHLTICIEALKSRGKKVGDSILKTPSNQKNISPNEENSLHEEENKSNTPSVKPEEPPAEEGKDTPNQKDETEQPDQTSNHENASQTSQQDKTQNQESNVSPSQRPDTSKSDSDKSATTKKSKTTAKEPNTETATEPAQNQSPIEIPDSTVLFEEESYLKENKKNAIDVDTFLTLIKQFYDEDEELVVLDHLHEYDDEIAEAFKAATDVNYDPFLEKLKKTLEQYENTLIKGDFKDDKEREATENLVQDIKDQITKITQSRLQTDDSDRGSKKKPLTLEEQRKRGLKELFTFYSKQHLPEGLEFGDILNKMEVIDLGEFCIFARDFKINIPKKKLIEVFKKTSNFHHSPLNFQQFCEVLDKIGVAMNDERIKKIKKRLKELAKIEDEREGSKKDQTETKEEKDSDQNSDDEGEGTTEKEKQTEKESEKDEEKSEKSEEEKDKTSKQGSDDGSEDSETESKSKVTKTNVVTESATKSQGTTSKNVKFTTKEGDGSSNDGSDSGSDSEEETDPVKIEKKKLLKELEKYENYGYKETHDEIMNFLEVHDQAKYRLRAKGVLVVPFFMKGKYGQARKPISQQLTAAQSSNDEKSEKSKVEAKEIRKKKIIMKEKMERIKQFKLRTRNQISDRGPQFNTLSPSSMNNKLNANLLQQNKTKVSLKPQARPSQKVTLDMLQGMNLKDFNSKRPDDFKPKDVLGSEDNDDFNSSVFNYFFPESKKNKSKVKKTTTNKFAVKKAVIKEPLNKINEEDAQTNYYSEHDNKSKKAKSKAGNLTSRALNQSKGSSTRRSMARAPLTGRKTNKSKSKSKPKTQLRKKSSQKSKMLSRAAQIDKQTKMKEKLTLNKVMKMHDAQMKKGMNVLRKKK